MSDLAVTATRNDDNLERLRRAAKLQRLQQLGYASRKKPSLAAIPVATRAKPLPLSWAQQRLWFLDQLDPAAGAAYHMPSALRLTGPLDVQVLRRVLDRIVARHENLRTTFEQLNGEPVQVIAPAACGFALQERDLREIEDPGRQEEEVQRLATQEARAPFDLARGPLIRAQLLRLGAQEHVLLVTQHHIVSDAWSIPLLLQEVSVLYPAFLAGQPDPLPPLVIQYADYAVWQRSWLQGPELERQLEFWRSHLQGAPASLTLPTDRPRPVVQTYAGGNVPIVLAAPLVRSLEALSQRNGTTVFMTLLAAWAVVLARLSGTDDLVIGTPVANRRRAEIEPLTGFFVNTLALRVRLESDPTVGELLAAVKATTLGAYEHQDVPFERVVEAVQPTRSRSHSPLFQVMLAFNNAPDRGEPRLPGLSVSAIRQRYDTAHIDLTLSLNERGDCLEGTLNYAADLFDGATIERWAQHLETTLHAMASNDRQSVGQLTLLGPRELHRVLVDFNATQAEFPAHAAIHHLFEKQVRWRPDALAVAAAGRQLTYAELNRRANQVAHHLLQLPMRPQERVAICTERSLEMVIAVLGVLKAGAAYVPLDPNYPPDRLAFMLKDCAPAALLAQPGLQARLPETQLPVILLDAQASWVAGKPDTDPDPAALGFHSGSLAYVIYTSGSTGLPKGVMVEHRSLCNLTTALIDAYAVTPESRVLQFVSFSFDVCTSEIAMALCSGASLHLASAEALRPGQPLFDTLQAHRITHVSLPLPALAALPLDANLDTVQTLVAGGDVCPPGVAQHWSARHRFFNAYGPTETTVCAAQFRCLPGHAGAVPIGRPIANTRIYILDARRQPVPIGVAGEIYIGGAGVARGYLNQPELTAERFLRDPFSVDGTPLYRTGDLGRWLADGTIDYLGRNDSQVKVRGFRIELSEIETQLLNCERVRAAAVVARSDVPGEKRLVAYVVAEEGVAAEILREALSLKLPDYMIPSAFVMLESLPLTPNGKLDRKALPPPPQDLVSGTNRLYEPPQNHIERAIAELWCALLGVRKIGRHDDFFELGGHSLLAAQVTSRLRQVLHVEVPLGTLFAHPTLAAFALQVEGAGRTHLPAIPVADRCEAIPLSWAQQRLWFLDQLTPAAAVAYHMPAALRLQGQLDIRVLRRALERIVARHENLRTTFATVNGTPVQVIASAASGFAMVERDLSEIRDARQQEEEVRRLATQEALAPFDLARGPLIRGQLLRLNEREHVLLVTQHHIVCDGWSIPVLLREVSTLYTAFLEGRPDPLAPLAIQYADYAIWQRAWLQADVLARQLDYWKRHLSGAPALLELPMDRPRPAVQTHAGASCSIDLPAPLVADLRELSKRHGVTLFMTLLAGWAIVLARLSTQDDLVIGTSVANRRRPEIEPLIGFFVNTLALRVRLEDDPTVVGLLAQVKASSLGAYEHQDVPFEQVVEALQPTRSMSHSPLFQAMLAFNNNVAPGELHLPGVTVSGCNFGQTTQRFDVTLAFQDSGGSLLGSLNYASDLFDSSTIARWAGYIANVLLEMTRDAQRRVKEIPLLDAREQRQWLVDFNDTQADFPRHVCIHQLFEIQVQQQPDAPAVTYEGRTLSYRELNRRANRIAHALLRLGIGPESRVALCVERSVEMVAGLLGILKAGAAYVPLDPTYPAERLAFMLQDCAPQALLTQAGLQAILPTDRPTLLLDAQEDCLAGLPEADPDPTVLGIHSGLLAYVTYTSGSAGLPKGVMVEHRSAVNFWKVLTQTTHRACRPNAQIGLNASYTFDMSLKGLLQLLSGHCLVIIPQHIRADAGRLCEFLEQHRIDAFDCTPSQLDILLRAGLIENPRYRPTSVLIGGEAISTAMWARLRGSTITQFFNMYGPTEATVDATLCSINGSGSLPHIGTPVANTQIYLLDNSGRPVPPGACGEIFIGGVGVARGYLNRPELTAERFLRNPFSPDTDARLYKTGDLARWRSDGTLEYLGRNDFQVKIRGFRVELGEIEARLRNCTGVQDAAVLAREDKPGDQRLVAYLILKQDAQPSVAQWRAQLSATLADFMIPSAFVVMPAFPLNANGKLDRKALPPPDPAAVSRSAYEAPQGPVESVLAGIWQDLLNLQQVGRHDHFFELGGHSLLAVQLLARVQKELGIEVALRELFSAPTLLGFAAAIADRTSTRAGLVPVRARGTAAPLFCVHPGEGEVGYVHELAPWLDANVPVYGLAAHGFLAGEVPHTSVEEMAACYIESIRQVQPRGPYRIVGWSAGGTIAYEIAHQLLGMDEEVGFLGLIDTTERYPPLLNPKREVAQAIEGSVTSDEASMLLAWCAEHASVTALERLQPLHAVNDIDGMLACCQTEGILPPDVPAQTLRRHVALRYAIASSVRSYIRPPIPVPVVLFSAADEPRSDPTLGWQRAIGPQLRHVRLGGTHRTIVEQPHVQSLGRAISTAVEEAANRPVLHEERSYCPRIIIRSTGNAGPPLFCAPGAGSSVTVFAGLAELLAPTFPIFGLQPRGLCGVMVPHIDVPSAARACIRAMREVAPRGPYRLLGHSFGGWIAYDIARQLEEEGEEIEALVLLDATAPARDGQSWKRYSRVRALLRLIELYELMVGRPLGFTETQLAALPEEAQLTVLRARLVELNVLPPRTPLQALRGIVRVFCTNLNTRYAPQGQYSGTLHLVLTESSDNEDAAHWRQFTASTAFHTVPGNHMTLLREPHIRALADLLRPILTSQPAIPLARTQVLA